MLREDLQLIRSVQEVDIQMLRLVRLKQERENELQRIVQLRDDLNHQVLVKEGDVIELKKQIRLSEGDIQDLKGKITKLESQQNSVKKVEEFNALTTEISSFDRERNNKEQKLADVYDKLTTEEDLLKNLKVSYESTKQNSEQIEKEIIDSIRAINEEGTALKKERDSLASKANPALLAVYQKLLCNKKDRVVVPIENRCCSGCHIVITAQHENIVRKGDKLVFCEHCSRIHYWHEPEGGKIVEEKTSSRRRRRGSKNS